MNADDAQPRALCHLCGKRSRSCLGVTTLPARAERVQLAARWSQSRPFFTRKQINEHDVAPLDSIDKALLSAWGPRASTGISRTRRLHRRHSHTRPAKRPLNVLTPSLRRAPAGAAEMGSVATLAADRASCSSFPTSGAPLARLPLRTFLGDLADKLPPVVAIPNERESARSINENGQRLVPDRLLRGRRWIRGPERHSAKQRLAPMVGRVPAFGVLPAGTFDVDESKRVTARIFNVQCKR